jgi:hypothetical protein
MGSKARMRIGLSAVEGIRWHNPSSGRGARSDAPDRTTGRCWVDMGIARVIKKQANLGRCGGGGARWVSAHGLLRE